MFRLTHFAGRYRVALVHQDALISFAHQLQELSGRRGKIVGLLGSYFVTKDQCHVERVPISVKRPEKSHSSLESLGVSFGRTTESF